MCWLDCDCFGLYSFCNVVKESESKLNSTQYVILNKHFACVQPAMKESRSRDLKKTKKQKNTTENNGTKPGPTKMLNLEQTPCRILAQCNAGIY